MNILHEYTNGNYTVKLYDDGTKERIYETDPIPVYPESMDLKITDYCDARCNFCHENSTVKGLHGNHDFIVNLLTDLPNGTEIAIGGGNPLSFPSFPQLVNTLSNKNLICNVTVNSVHIRVNRNRLMDYMENKVIRGLGISYFPSMHDECAYMANNSSNVVFHVIMGVHTVDDLKRIVATVNKPKVLLLGYKQHGRGRKYYSPTVEKNLRKWYTHLHEFFQNENCTISFDNLGISQMNLKRFFTTDNWNRFYMGDDGKYTMYIDAVKQQYAVSSTSVERFDVNNRSISQIFQHVRSIKL